MNQPPELEFVLVSSDYATMQTISKGVKKFGAKFILVPTAHDARECLSRRKVDGVFVDMEVPGALGLVESTRKGSSNNKVVIFACGGKAKEATQTLAMGANFLLRKPVTEDAILMHLTISKDLLMQERRRYFRHPVNLPVTLKEGETEQLARMVNLSGDGMAVRLTRPVKKGIALDFAFELSLGVHVNGKGQVAWVNSEGLAGIMLQMLRGNGKDLLDAWLAAREELDSSDRDKRG